MSHLNRWWVWCLAALVLGLALGWASPPPPLPKPKAAGDDWSSPAEWAGGRRPSTETRALAQRARWDGDVDGGGPQGPWRLAGIASGPVALVQLLEDKKILRLERGATLPDDATLLQIGQDRIRIQRDGCIEVHQLYRSEPISSEGTGCPGDAGDNAAASGGATGGGGVGVGAGPGTTAGTAVSDSQGNMQ